MGAWGTGPFENDDALDWVASLVDSSDDEPAMALEAAAQTGDPELLTCNCGLAAAEVVAAARGYPCSRFPREVRDWIAERQFYADRQLTRLAIDAVANVKQCSSLARECKGDAGWTRRMKNLLERLGRPSKVRKPRAKSTKKIATPKVASPTADSGQKSLIMALRKKNACMDVTKAGEIKGIDLSDSEKFHRADLPMLSGAVAAEFIAVGMPKYSTADLRPFEKLKRLRSLSLHSWDDPFTDSHAKSLGKLRSLEELDLLGQSEISDVGLKHLSGLASLHSLKLRTKCCTKRGLAAFRKALPKCRIHEPATWEL